VGRAKWAIGPMGRVGDDALVPPALPRRRQPTHPEDPATVRSVLSLLAGIAISIAGVIVVVRSPYDIAGVLLITAGVVVSVLVPMTSPQRSRG